MVTRKILIYTALTSTLLGGATTYYLIHKDNFGPRDEAAVSSTASQSRTTGGALFNNTDIALFNTSNIDRSFASITSGNILMNVNGAIPNYNQQDTQGSQEEGTEVASKAAGNSSINPILNSNFKIGTQKGYKLIKPVLWAKPAKESQAFSALKQQLIKQLEADRKQSLLTSASVYLYSFADGEWTYINPNESFNPGSLNKVPMLITYLLMAEKDPKIMNKKILCENFGYIPTHTWETHSINPGRTYTVRELLHSMIAYSDNNATNLLFNNADLRIFRKTFTDLNIPEPDIYDLDYKITAKRYSRFLIVLYNASYLSRSASEYALQLLSECDFKEGLVKDLPQNVPVAHKFGEWGNNKQRVHVLSESGIVYYNDKPYLLTVMTKGKDVKNLAPEISKISRMTYDFIATMNNPNM